MYEAHFGFERKPFALLPDPAFLYLSKKHRTGLALLEYGLLNQAGFTVVSGEIGCGKTTLIQTLLRRMRAPCTVGVLSNTHDGLGVTERDSLLAWILQSFALPHTGTSEVDCYERFVGFVHEQHAQGQRTVAVVDEAQNLSVTALEALRLLSNINTGSEQMLQLILVGQPELMNKLRRPDLRQFAQRVAVHYVIAPLNLAETCGYLRHRCRIAGRRANPFSKAAMLSIFAASQGIPRVVNLLADTALVYAYGAGAKSVTESIADEVVGDRLDLRPVSPALTEDDQTPQPQSQAEKDDPPVAYLAAGRRERATPRSSS